MRKNIFRLVLVSAFVSIIISCAKEDGTTTSPSSSTPTLDRDKFLGNWQVESHHSTGQTLFWGMDFLEATSTSEVYIDNLDQMGAGNHVTATVSGSTFTIPQQSVSTSSGTEIFSGSGSYTGGNLSFNYIVDDGTPNIDTVSATAHR